MSGTEKSGTTDVKGATFKLPEWLKAELFEDVLKRKVSGYKRTTNFKAYPGLGAGENYATIMLRVEIEVELGDGKKKTVPFVMKIPHDNEMFQKMLKESNVFKLESGMFLDVVPEFQQLYREAGVDVKFGAQCYKLNTSEYYILLDDLRPEGFRNAVRQKAFDMEHTKWILKKLALWHAASAVRVATKGQYKECYTTGIFKDSQRPIFIEFFRGMNKVFMQCIEKYRGNEEYVENLKKLQQVFVDKLFRMDVVDENEFNVLNHGDCWSNNIMFKYDDAGNIEETFFVDYQIPKYGPPVQDLYYLIFSSTQDEIKLKYFDSLIKFYHDILIENLTLLKYPQKLPTLKDIHISLIKYGLWGYASAVGLLSLVLCDPSEKAGIDNLLGDTDDGISFKLLMFTNERYVKHIEAILPWLNNRGAFEI